MILGVDLDNVLAKTNSKILEFFKSEFGISKEEKDVTDHDYAKCIATKAQRDKVLEIFHEKECPNLEPISEGIAALTELKKRFEIHVVTSRPSKPEIMKQTIEWLVKHNVPCKYLDFRDRKQESEVDFTVFVEDHREKSYDFARHGVCTFLLQYPWNSFNLADPENLHRVNSWDEIVGLINGGLGSSRT